MSSNSEDRRLAFTPAWELVEMIKSKRLSPVELTAAILRRIEHLNPRLNAYLTLAEEQAMEAARQAEAALTKQNDLGLLHGLPISIKDLCNTKGIRTTFGSLVYKDFVPDEDDIVVKRLKAAGAIIVGKTNTPEFGFAAVTENKLGDPCRNPWNSERTSGGSSGGAASSVAAGIGPLALGNDGGGSIRIPASFCGVYGIKPTGGRVPFDPDPVYGLLNELPCHGPITRTVRDAALMMNVLSGPDSVDYTCIRTVPPNFLEALNGSRRQLRIAWSSDLGYAVVDPEVKSIAETALHIFEQLGHDVEEAKPATGSPFCAWEVIATSGHYITKGSLLDEQADKLTDYNRSALEFARKLSGAEVARAWGEVLKWRGAMLDFFEKYDLLITPTTAVPAFPIGEKNREFGHGLVDWAFVPFTAIFNCTGNPAATVPCGFSSDGLPVGLQIVAKLESDIEVLRISAAFENSRPWVDKYPSVS